MGQRSQIYIRYNVNYISGSSTENPTTHNFKGLIARYYGWNYGERMVSRARYIIERIHDEFMRGKWCFGDAEKRESSRKSKKAHLAMDFLFKEGQLCRNQKPASG